MEDNYFRNYTSSEDDFNSADYTLQDMEEAFKSLLEIEYNKDGTIKHVYADDVKYSIKISAKGKTFSCSSEEGGNEYLIYLILAFLNRKRKRDEEDL